MASSDLRDVLNLDAHAGPRPAKKLKTAASRPNLKGLAREVQNLGGDNPIAIVPEVSDQKQERGREREREWEQVLEDSAFAKYNVHVDVPQYSPDQYQSNLVSADWTKDETDYLMGLVREFDLRWPVIWDRYDYAPEAINGEASADGDESKAIIPVPKPRTMEALKARYYEIAAKMMSAQTPVQYMTKEEFALHETMLNFNPQQERVRKDFAVNGLSRTKEEANEEESLLVEIKRILARSSVFNEERRELYNRLDYPHTDQDINAFKSSTGLQTLLQNMMAVDKNKKRKSLMGADGTPHERRKLSEAEKFIYGVSHHDRLQAGPTFRYEKINKLFTNKSGQQQIRIANALNELDIPQRLVMPTAAVTAQFEQLLGAINSLLDARKVTDKIDAEIKIELAKKAQREPKDKDKDKDKDKEEDKEEQAKDAKGENPAKGSAAEAAKGDKAKDDGQKDDNDNNDDDNEPAKADKNADRKEDAATEEPAPAAAASVETNEEKASPAKAARPPSSSGPHKRSASVLSGVSDKSAKRLKK
ncbi:40S ribosomal protein S23 [Verticillium dahliae VDG1]|nr:40S ribosomal protein S23 [Verticillium dahliae VDG1]